MPQEPVLGPRALNRATLARQMLLERHTLPAAEAITRLVGLQAQAPNAPYVGLWSRLAGFRPGELAGMITERQAVRIHVMRATIHLVTADDAVRLRPLTQCVITRGFNGQAYARNIAGIDQQALLEAGRELLADQPMTRAALAPLLAARWPDHDPTSMVHAVTYLVPVVQIPPRGLWERTGPAAWALAEQWLGRPLGPPPPLGEFVLRYLAAFGPATVNDVQAWSGLTRLAEVIEELRPRLRTFRGQGGAELFDLPDAPRPGPEAPAPPRFLPEYDNLLLSHADRGRVITDGRMIPLPPGNGARAGTFLIDGAYQGDWRITREKETAALEVRPFRPLSAPDRDALTGEGGRLLAFAAAGAARPEVRLLPATD
jgi:hypothetical protein